MPMPRIVSCAAAFSLVFSVAAHGQDAPPPSGEPAIDAAEAERYFREAADVFAADDGALWGMNLQGPIMFVDLATRTVVTNHADAQGQLSRQGNVHTGTIPAEVPVANTAVDWAGVTWAMVMWPLAEDELDRKAVLAHES